MSGKHDMKKWENRLSDKSQRKLGMVIRIVQYVVARGCRLDAL